MIETDSANYSIRLHGFYDYKVVLLDNRAANGAVTFNEKFEEIAIKIEDEWFFVENHDKVRPNERFLFEAITTIAEKRASDEEKAALLSNVLVSYNLVSVSGEKKVNILEFASLSSPVVVERPSKEEYIRKLKDFGTF